MPDTRSPASYTPKHLAERILTAQAALEARGATDGERKTITALFADIKGSMALIEDLDPEEARSLIDPALQLMMDAVHRYEGYVVQSTGDGIFAFFGAPLAHEDHPQRALYAALRMQEEMKRYAERLRLEKGWHIDIRVGINTGDVVLRSIRKDDLRTEYTPISHSTSLASRLEGLAPGGSVVVSEHTQRLTEGYFEFKSLGAARVKGVSDPVPIYEVLGVGPLRTRLQVATHRGLTRFVGRQPELDQLRRALELATGGHGQIVGIVGEPGVGKSRLFYEFKLLVQRGCLVLETFSVSHSKAYPYLPLLDLLKNYFQILPQDEARQVREKVTGKVLILDRALEDTLPYLLLLLGVAEPTSSLGQMDPQVRKRRTLEAIKRLLVRESLSQPLIVIFEDLHWLDSETQAFLSLLSESLATAPILLLVNYRPEYRHEWGNKTYYTQLRLDPLQQDDSQELLTALLGNDGALQPLKQFILEKTEGNPFFMEEIVQAFREQGVLPDSHRTGTAQQHVGATGWSLRPTDLHIPPTVQGILASRIDRLPPPEKELLQTLAVIGKEFSLSLVCQVVGQAEDRVQGLLAQLQAAEFIYEQPAFPEVEYTFKHALTQEVAYNSLLIERRKMVHEQTGQGLETLFHSRLEDHYGDLAHHYSRSSNMQKAIEYLQLAGQQAVQRSAYPEAISQLTVALELLKALPETLERKRQELAVQIALGPMVAYGKGFAVPEVGQIYTRAWELCQHVGETLQLFPTALGLRTFYHVGGELQTARKWGEQLLTLAQNSQDPAFFVLAHRALGATLFLLGELAPARAHLEQSIALYDSHSHRSDDVLYGQTPGVMGRNYLAWTLWSLGYAEQALARTHEAFTVAQERSDPNRLATALVGAAQLHQHRRERQATQERAETLIALSTEHGIATWLAVGTILQGWALADQGQAEEGIAQMRRGLAAARATGAESQLSHLLALLTGAYGKAEQTEEGLNTLAEALAVVNKTGERYYEAELYRLKGTLTLQSQVPGPKSQVEENPESAIRSPQSEVASTQHLTPNTHSEAGAYFQKAIDIAQRQQAKSLELRATVSLARLWQQQGRTNEAHAMLASIYNWFTEGFDTVDLQEAKALLAELGEER
ncbi:MAG: AAA family ATPase [Deltaproteobacteria bacterium]|nr:AAA family ATPase [Deltaproteobacteria bacterium]